MQTRWRVVAGAPRAGKTSIINRLAALGHPVRPEGATLYIQSQLQAGRSLDDICAVHNQLTLQRQIARTNAELEDEIGHLPEVPFVLDRSVVEVLAYCRLYVHDDADVRRHIRRRYHPRIILLDRLPFEPNPVRCENDAVAETLDRLIEGVYRNEGYDVVRIPVPVHPDPTIPAETRIAWSIDERLRLILSVWNGEPRIS